MISVDPDRYEDVVIDGRTYSWPVYKAKTSDPNWLVHYRMRVEKPEPFWIVIENNGMSEIGAGTELVRIYNRITKAKPPFALSYTQSCANPGEFNESGFWVVARSDKNRRRWQVLVVKTDIGESTVKTLNERRKLITGPVRQAPARRRGAFL
jgi:hypothetical protein